MVYKCGQELPRSQTRTGRLRQPMCGVHSVELQALNLAYSGSRLMLTSASTFLDVLVHTHKTDRASSPSLVSVPQVSSLMVSLSHAHGQEHLIRCGSLSHYDQPRRLFLGTHGRQCLKITLILTTEGMLLVSCGQGLLSIP